MGLTHVTVTLRATQRSRKKFEAIFLVDAGSSDSMAPAKKLKAIGVSPAGKKVYELADGTKKNMNSESQSLSSWGRSQQGELYLDRMVLSQS